MKRFKPVLLFVLLLAVSLPGAGSVALGSDLIVKTAPAAGFTGSWKEIGRQVASTYPEYVFDFGVAMNIALVFAGPGRGWTPQVYFDTIKEMIPLSIQDHLEGLAEGLSEALFISYRTAWHLVLTQNFATELMNMRRAYSDIPRAWDRGCTGFAVSSDQGLFLCHNTDAPAAGMDNIVVIMHWQPTNGDYAYITMDPPGWADVSYGINENAIAASLNAGLPNTGCEVGLPVSFMIRYVMENAASLEQAVGFFTDFLESGNNFGTSGSIVFLADFNAGTMAKLQIRSRAIEVNYGNHLPNGAKYVAAANHFTDSFSPDPDFYYESSFKRHQRLRELIHGTDRFDLDACWNILSDTRGGEEDDNTISRVGRNSYTMFAHIFSEEAISYTMGPPSLYRRHFGEPEQIAYSDLASSPIASFAPHPGFARITLNWQTAEGADISGVNIYRADSQQGEYRKINPFPVAPDIGRYEDSLLKNRNRYYYRLEAEHTDGRKTAHGPVCATPKLIYLFTGN